MPRRSASAAAPLGVTFNNILDRDYATVEAYRAFREDAVKNRFRHFLEVFNPNPRSLVSVPSHRAR